MVYSPARNNKQHSLAIVCLFIKRYAVSGKKKKKKLLPEKKTKIPWHGTNAI